MSPKIKPLVVALAGLGTVGGGLAQLLGADRKWVIGRIGRDVVIKYVIELRKDLELFGAAKDATLTADADAALGDPEVDVFVELIGGTTAARMLIAKALENGKHVVTANKALLAEHGDELFALARKKGLHLRYEASVGGGIPIVDTIMNPLAANRAERILGILNGTCNFILTQMTHTGLDFATALKQAQEKGYAEADPTLDIEGWDTAHKLTLLIQLAFGQRYPLKKLPVTGVSVVTPMDIQYAKALGFRIKLIAQARALDGKIEAGVYPALVPEEYLLAQVEGSLNALRLDGAAGPVMLHGHGAGDLPTASAVLADIMAVASGREPNNTGFAAELPEARILDLDEAVSLHYLRFMVQDRPGVLRDIGTVMASRDISLKQVVQKGEDSGQGVPIVFLTHEATAAAVHAAMRDIDELRIPVSRTMHYRIL